MGFGAKSAEGNPKPHMFKQGECSNRLGHIAARLHLVAVNFPHGLRLRYDALAFQSADRERSGELGDCAPVRKFVRVC